MGGTMTKSADINLLYTELGKLLYDICGFLNDEAANGFLSESGKLKANSLIQRSKQQLQTISVINAITDAPLESYVDMNGSKGDQLTDQQEVYTDISLVFEKNSNSSQTEDNFIMCPYENTPASETFDGKSGQLYRKEKILFFEQTKKVFAAILFPWLVIYPNEYAPKPIQTIDLTLYQAFSCVDLPNNIKKKEESFDLIEINGTKSFRFIAFSSKDMLQWISAINKSSESTMQTRCLPPVPTVVEAIATEEELMPEDDVDYEPLEQYQINKEPDISQFPMSTPLLSPKPKPIPYSSKSSSLDHIVQESTLKHSVSGSSTNTFSSDDSDKIYDKPEDLLQENKSTNTKNKTEVAEEEDIYDYLQKDSNDINNPVTTKMEQPKPPIKPKLFSFRNRKKN